MTLRICMMALCSRGGMLHYSSQLANALAKKGVEVHVIVFEKANCRYFEENVKVTCISWPRRIPNLRHLRIDAILRNVLTIKPNLIHATVTHPLLITLLFLKKKYPLVYTAHDTNRRADWQPYLWVSIAKMLLKYSDTLFVHGVKLKNDLATCGIDEKKIVAIPHGDYSFFTRFKKNHSGERNVVLFFGRIQEYKGIKYLIEAEPLITREVPDAKILIAGEGDLSRYKSLSKSENFEIINRYVPDAGVAELFERCSVVVLPYTEASQSGVIPIAYAFKKPVIATSVGSIPEIVDDGVTGLLVPPKDPKSIALAVIKLLKDDQLRKTMGESSYKKMQDCLSWNGIAEKTIQAYRKAIEEHQKLPLRHR